METLDHLTPEGWTSPEPGVHGDGLGLFGGALGSGHHRFWFTPRERRSQDVLFDRTSGLLLRESHPVIVVRALYLYPPGSVDAANPEQECFMLLLGLQPNARFSGDDDDLRDVLSPEYERLSRLVVEELADLSLHHSPTVCETH